MQDRVNDTGEAWTVAKLRRHVRILVDTGRLMGEGGDLNRFFDQAVVQIARAVEIHHVKILQYRPRTSDLLVVAGMGWKNGVVGKATLSADLRSAPGRAFRTAEPISVENLNQQQDYIVSDMLKEHGIVSLLNVPVLIDGSAWGVLEVDGTKPRHFTDDTVEFLRAAAALLGSAITRYTEPDREARTLAAAAEAQKNEVLLRELQHRVKNNFQLVLSSIAIQKRRYEGAEVHRALDHIASRIHAISLAHDQLAVRHDVQTVRLSDYIRALCNSIRQQSETVEVDVETDELELTIDRALPLGLVLNEIAMNSIKHAFEEAGGRINIKLVGGVGFGDARLTVSDNGRGIQGSNEGGSGLKLIASLARQMGGIVDQQSSHTGTTTVLTFPLIA